MLELFGIPTEFFIFGLTLVGIAVLHRHALPIALGGLATIVAFKLGYTGFDEGDGLAGLARHFLHEWVILVNLLCLLLGFSLISRHFEDSGVPAVLPHYLPDGWTGGFALLGDTTTTMMWIAGVAPLDVLHAYVAAIVALLVFGIPAALQQHRWSPIIKDAARHAGVDWPRLVVVAVVLASAVTVNVVVNNRFPEHADQFPFIGVTVAVSMLATLPVRKPDWKVMAFACERALASAQPLVFEHLSSGATKRSADFTVWRRT